MELDEYMVWMLSFATFALHWVSFENLELEAELIELARLSSSGGARRSPSPSSFSSSKS